MSDSFLSYLGDVEQGWSQLKDEPAPKKTSPNPKKKVVNKKVIRKKVVESSNDEYQRYLQLKKKFEKEEYLKLKKKFEGQIDEDVEEVEEESPPTTPRGHAAYILEGMDDEDTPTGDVSHITGNDPAIDIHEARSMSQEDLNKMSPKSHASLLL